MVQPFMPMLILLCPLAAGAAGSGRQVFNVVDFGAKRDGSSPATEAFPARDSGRKSGRWRHDIRTFG